MRAATRFLCALVVGVTAGRAAAEPRDQPAKNHVNFRTGVATLADRAVLCLEVAPLGQLSLEACGTGAGFLHKDPDPEIAHFRGKWTITSLRAREAWIQPTVGLGFAELQIDRDAEGFAFTGTDPTGTSTAGAEASVSVRTLWNAGSGLDFVLELGAALAYFPYAPDLIRPMNTWQPTAMLTFGIGY